MSLYEKIVAVGGGVGLTVLVIAILFAAFVYISFWGLVKNALLSGGESTFGVVLFLFIGLEAAILFLLPPVMTVILYERKAPAGNSKELFALGVASSAVATLAILAIVQSLSADGWGKVFSEPSAFVFCPVAFVLWCVLSGLLGPATSFIKKRMKK